ncbi:MAG: hypothetical protein N2380_08680, partial [bacterium]|nr:hypothetical protein [bacterium]
PAVIINSYGRGRVVYFAFPIGTFYGSDRIGTQEQLISAGINYLRDSVIEVSASPTVEVEFYRQKDKNRFILFLVNNTGDMQRPLGYINPVNNIEVSIKISSIKSIYSVANESYIDFKQSSDGVIFVIPFLKEFDIIRLEEE